MRLLTNVIIKLQRRENKEIISQCQTLTVQSFNVQLFQVTKVSQVHAGAHNVKLPEDHALPVKCATVKEITRETARLA